MKSRLSIRSGNRIWCILLGFLLVAAGCGGGGGGGTLSSSGVTVHVSMTKASGFPAGTSFTASPASVEAAAKPVSPDFDNVFVKIWKVALLPAKEGDGPDSGGEALSPDDDSDRSGEFIAVELDSPKDIDLLNLPSGQKLARFLERFVNVPAGTYGKIRVYYEEVWGIRGVEVIPFHPTANSHFDVHFVGGDLVIPIAPDPERGIHLFEVTINFVGLKIVENKNKVLMRPQVFAELENLLYSVSGRAANVTSGAFDIVQDDSAVTPVHVTYSDPTWFFEDTEEGRRVNVDAGNGTAALRQDTKVEAIGTFSGEDLVAQEIIITFEEFLEGEVVSGDPAINGWTTAERLVLDLPPENVVVPKPSRGDAVYDDAETFGPLTYTDVKQGATVKARGYLETGVGINAFWISVSAP